MKMAIAILSALLVSLGSLLLVNTAKNRTLKAGIKVAKKRATNLATLQSTQQKIRRKTHDEKTALATTPNSQLLDRANNLFL